MVPLVASTFGHLHSDFLRFLWNFALVDRNHPALFDLYRTGEVRNGYCGTDDEATKIQKAIFLKLKARVTSLVARSAASRMLGYTCELTKTIKEADTHKLGRPPGESRGRN
jgi:hypothetical protein